MKTTILTSLLIFFVGSFLNDAIAQKSLEEEAVIFAAEYQKANDRKDIVFLERHIDDQFISVGPNSSIWDKSQALENAARPNEKQDFKVIEVKGIPVKTMSSGNIVVLISNWKVVRQANSPANAVPQTDSGTTTGVYQKTDIWRILSEHVAFDRPTPTNSLPEIDRISGILDRSLVFRNYDYVERLLAPEYMRVNELGMSAQKAAFLSELRSRKLVILSIKTSNVYINQRENTAVETGLVDIKGTFEEVEFLKSLEYTRIWKQSDDQWRVTADYFR